MNLSNIQSCLVHAQTSIRSLILRCGPSCTHRSQVHPEICYPEDQEFVQLGSQRVIRVLHLSQKPINHFLKHHITDNRTELASQNEKRSRNFDVSTEEYWFARSNRPFRNGDVCDCISSTYASSRQLAGSPWKHTTEGCEAIKNSDDFQSRIYPRERTDRVIETFAENFAKVLLNEVFCPVLNKCMPLQENLDFKNEVLNSQHVQNSVYSNGHTVTHNLLNNIRSRETKAEVHHSNDDKSEDNHLSKGHECNLENEVMLEVPHETCNVGIVNLSFSGTINEPDAFHCSGYDDAKIFEDLLASSELLQCKLEILSGDKENLEHKDCAANSALSDSRPKENLALNKVLETLKNDHLNESVMEITNSSFPKEASLHTSNINKHQGECSVNTENIPGILSSCSSDPMDKKSNIKNKINPDCCRHTKNTQKPLLLFLHGAGSSADIWSVLLEYFASAGYEVLAPDMLGHGYSSAPDIRAAYTFDRLLQDILQIFDRFVSDHQNCIVIGHSYGSCFAAALARYRPQQVVQLVLLSSGGPSPLVPKQAFFSFPSCVMSFMKPFLLCGFKRDLFYAPRGKHLPPCCTYELPPYVLKHVECGQEWSDGDSAFHRRILVPTLLVHGLKDPYITLVEECEMERTIPRSFLEVISNAGHMMMLDSPEQLCHMIHSFITWWNS